MKLRGLTCSGIPGLADSAFDLSKPNGEAHDLVLITGEEATGKTRLLGLIAAARDVLAPLGEETNQDAWVRFGQLASKTVLTFQLSEEERENIGAEESSLSAEVIFRADPDVTATDQTDPSLLYLLERYDHDDAIGSLEFFGENRRLDIGGGEISLDPLSQKEFRTTTSPRKFAFLPLFLASIEKDRARADRFASTLARFGTTCHFDVDQGALISRGRPIRELTELTMSETDAVIMSATATLVRLSNSIVLVDRPELYRSDDAAAVLQGLRGLGENNQLILATNAPSILETELERTIIRLDERAPLSTAPRSASHR